MLIGRCSIQVPVRASANFSSASGKRNWPEIRRGSKVSLICDNRLSLSKLASMLALRGRHKLSYAASMLLPGNTQRNAGIFLTFSALRIVPTSVRRVISARIHDD